MTTSFSPSKFHQIQIMIDASKFFFTTCVLLMVNRKVTTTVLSMRKLTTSYNMWLVLRMTNMLFKHSEILFFFGWTTKKIPCLRWQMFKKKYFQKQNHSLVNHYVFAVLCMLNIKIMKLNYYIYHHTHYMCNFISFKNRPEKNQIEKKPNNNNKESRHSSIKCEWKHPPKVYNNNNSVLII